MENVINEYDIIAIVGVVVIFVRFLIEIFRHGGVYESHIIKLLKCFKDICTVLILKR
jgi:hypothetical protein